MQNLEKILEEIENERTDIDDYSDAKSRMLARHWNSCIDVVEDIICKHMNDGWIPVDEKMPEESEEFNDVYDPVTLAVIDTEWHEKSDIVQVTVYDRDEEKYFTYVDNTYNGEWVTFNLDNFKVIAWKPLSDPYRPERSEGE